MKAMRLAGMLLTLVAASPTLADPLVVTAPAGAVRGVMLDGGVRSFRGVPFAQPPVGPLRWQEPQPMARWPGVRDATHWASRCMQGAAFLDMQFRSPGISEDCLYLNIWTPANATPKSKLPVLLYIYGGGFIGGSADEKRYDGASLARRGIVVVTVNYRLGVFGFFSHPELSAESPHHASGNQGLLDQAAALGWVRNSIAAFGGDPGHITIGGESAGSFSVSMMMVSPLSAGMIAGAIGESGAAMGDRLKPVALADAETNGAAFAGRIGAPSLAALRALPAEALLAKAGDDKGFKTNEVVDGYYLPGSLELLYKSSAAAHVPLLVGSNSQEGPAGAVLGDGVAPTVAAYRAGIAKHAGAAADQVAALYPAATDGDVTAAATELASDMFLGQQTWKWFELHRLTGAPTYYYRYNRVRPPALTLPNPTTPPVGAVHSAEIEYALGNLDVNPLYAWTAGDRTVSATMEGYWANFIKTGNPNGAGLPRWPAAGDGDRPSRQTIDVTSEAKPFTDEARYRAMDKLPPMK